ncbi:unnamed protein product [Amoebophrya sp. A120]|nr:unnamed protein product [Amoebophrya sp. A120]|eukprot:GSA120T00014431001.1
MLRPRAAPVCAFLRNGRTPPSPSKRNVATTAAAAFRPWKDGFSADHTFSSASAAKYHRVPSAANTNPVRNLAAAGTTSPWCRANAVGNPKTKPDSSSLVFAEKNFTAGTAVPKHKSSGAHVEVKPSTGSFEAKKNEPPSWKTQIQSTTPQIMTQKYTYPAGADSFLSGKIESATQARFNAADAESTTKEEQEEDFVVPKYPARDSAVVDSGAKGEKTFPADNNTKTIPLPPTQECGKTQKTTSASPVVADSSSIPKHSDAPTTLTDRFSTPNYKTGEFSVSKMITGSATVPPAAAPDEPLDSRSLSEDGVFAKLLHQYQKKPPLEKERILEYRGRELRIAKAVARENQLCCRISALEEEKKTTSSTFNQHVVDKDDVAEDSLPSRTTTRTASPTTIIPRSKRIQIYGHTDEELLQRVDWFFDEIAPDFKNTKAKSKSSPDSTTTGGTPPAALEAATTTGLVVKHFEYLGHRVKMSYNVGRAGESSVMQNNTTTGLYKTCSSSNSTGMTHAYALVQKISTSKQRNVGKPNGAATSQSAGSLSCNKPNSSMEPVRKVTAPCFRILCAYVEDIVLEQNADEGKVGNDDVCHAAQEGKGKKNVLTPELVEALCGTTTTTSRAAASRVSAATTAGGGSSPADEMDASIHPDGRAAGAKTANNMNKNQAATITHPTSTFRAGGKTGAGFLMKGTKQEAANDVVDHGAGVISADQQLNSQPGRQEKQKTMPTTMTVPTKLQEIDFAFEMSKQIRKFRYLNHLIKIGIVKSTGVRDGWSYCTITGPMVTSTNRMYKQFFRVDETSLFNAINDFFHPRVGVVTGSSGLGLAGAGGPTSSASATTTTPGGGGEGKDMKASCCEKISCLSKDKIQQLIQEFKEQEPTNAVATLDVVSSA